MERVQLFRGELVGAARGMNARAPQTFVGIDIADAAHGVLTEQQRFDARGARSDFSREIRGVDFERVFAPSRAQVVDPTLRRETHLTEAASVRVAEFVAVVQGEKNVRVRGHGLARIAGGDAARHAEMNYQI